MMYTLFLPMIVQVGLTFAITALLPLRRTRDIKADRSLLKRGAIDNSVYSDNSRKLANNYANQFEMPVLFYVAVLASLILGNTSLLAGVFAWGFVGARIIHTIIHTTANVVLYRFYAFAAGFVALIGLWATVVMAAAKSPLLAP